MWSRFFWELPCTIPFCVSDTLPPLSALKDDGLTVFSKPLTRGSRKGRVLSILSLRREHMALPAMPAGGFSRHLHD